MTIKNVQNNVQGVERCYEASSAATEGGSDVNAPVTQQARRPNERQDNADDRQHHTVALKLYGALDCDALEQATHNVVRKLAVQDSHDVLTATTVGQAGEQPQAHQAAGVRPGDGDCNGHGEFRFVDDRFVDGCPADSAEWTDDSAEQTHCEQIVARELQRPFDPEQDPALRVTVHQLAHHRYLLTVCACSTALDQHGVEPLLSELAVVYQSYLSHRPCLSHASHLSQDSQDPAALATETEPHDDAANRHSDWLDSEAGRATLAFWQQALAAIPPLHNLPLDYARPRQQTFATGVVEQTWDHARAASLRQLCARTNTCAFSALHGLLALLLGRYSNSHDVVMGTPLTGETVDHNPLAGMENHLVLRSQRVAGERLDHWLTRNAESVKQAVAHGDMPFAALRAELQPERNLNHHPLFQIRLAVDDENGNITSQWVSPQSSDPSPALQNAGYRATTELNFAGLRAERLALPGTDSPYDLDINISIRGDALLLRWQYNRDLFKPSTIQRLAASLAVLLDSAANDAQHTVDDVPLLSPAQQTELIQRHQETQAAPLTLPLVPAAHRLFEHLASAQAQQTALVCGPLQYSYAQLNQRANQIAHRLLAHGVGAEQRVGVCLSRNVDLVAALLGVMKAGAAYVPLDPDYPRERLNDMLADAGAAWLITADDVEVAATLTVAGLNQINLSRAGIAAYPETNPDVDVDRDQLAYVLYTSGSTGRPKGVAIRHEAVLALVAWAQQEFGGELLDGVLASTSVCFDLSVFELFAPLCTGGRVVLAQNALSLLAFDRWDAVTLVNTVPSAIDALVSHQRLPDNVRAVNLAGEALTRETVQRVLDNSAVQRVYNLYGPSEDTTYSTGSRADLERGARPAIGQPVAASRTYVLDESLWLAPDGVTGELYLGGVGVARGYLGRPALTAERFLPDPHAPTPGARMYRTGDLVRYRDDGQLDYIGRIDHQVKLRGFRIELGEIESRLREQPGVDAALVQVLDGELGQQLVGYVVAADHVSETALQQALAQTLPAYMVPAAIVCLDAFPLTANGKVDRKQLPAPDWRRYRQTYVAPRNDDERVLAGIYADLLGITPIGIDDNFFKLGGHSLLATQLISRVRDALDVALPMRQVFEHATVADLARNLRDREQAGDDAAIVLPALLPTAAAAAEDIADGTVQLSYAQQRLWFLDQLEGGSTQYNLPYAFRLSGALDVAALTQALNAIVSRHEVLRGCFIRHDGDVLQHIRDTIEVPLEQRDLRATAADQIAAVITEHVASEAHQPFDLSRDAMLRGGLLRLPDDGQGNAQWLFTLTLHHIAADGWSVRVLLHELNQLYAARVNGEAAALPDLPLQYHDYARWQRQWLASAVKQPLLDYWQQQLATAEPVHSLPLDYPRPQQPQRFGVVHTCALGRELSEQLNRLCQQQDVTLFMLLHTAFSLLLGRYSQQQDIVTGTTIAGRDQLAIEPLIGYFVNTVVLRTRFQPDQTFIDVLNNNKQTILDAFAYQHLPFDQLVEVLRPERHLHYSPIIQIIFTMMDAEGEALALPGVTVEDISRRDDTLNFDLRLSVREQGQGIDLEWVYNPQLFAAETIQRMADNFTCLLRGISQQPRRPINRLPYVTAQEQQILLDGAGGAAAAVADAAVHRAFEGQAAAQPDAVALVAEAGQLTYGALNRQANQLAHELIARGVQPGAVVGLCVQPSLDMVVAILAVLKAGAAYVPLDPANPAQRSEYMLDDAGAQWLLSQRSLADALPASQRQRIVLDDDGLRRQLDRQPHTNPELACAPGADDAVYVIYTSGSTGLPKGVTVTHGNLGHFQNVFEQQLHDLGVQGAVPWLWSSAYVFDASFKGVLTLNRGGRVVIADAQQRVDAGRLAELLIQHRIPVFNGMPLLVEHVLEQVRARLADGSRGVSLIVGGDEISAQLWADIADYCEHHGCRAINAYGPTELTINATYAAIQHDAAPNIGREVMGSVAYVLDEDQQLLPLGVAGELYVGGNGVARGYCRRAALSAERFVPDPFSHAIPGSPSGARLYRTGDKVRRLADGRFEFLGRIDHQVKIRGFRIELGEIEALIQQQPEVVQARVLVRENQLGEKQLAAYVQLTTAAHQAADTGAGDTLKPALAQQVPAYMVPDVWTMVTAMPLTVTGKVDTQALLAMTDEVPAAAAPAQPASELEQQLTRAWCATLGVDHISSEANFFELGGHSLLAIKLINQVREDIGAELDLQQVFEHPTIASMATILQPAAADGVAGVAHGIAGGIAGGIAAVRRDGPLPLSFVQQRLVVIDQLEGGSSQYNVPWAFRIQGELDCAALTAAIETIVQRHEVLHTTYVQQGDDFLQLIQTDYPSPVTRVDLRRVAAAQREQVLREHVLADAQQAFDLQRDVLLRAHIIQLAADDHALLINMHHIVTDAWSAGIFFDELRTLYRAYQHHDKASLPVLPVQYADYACWQREQVQGEWLNQQLAYWQQALAGIPAVHSLPLDQPRPQQQSFKGKTHYVPLDAATSQQVYDAAQRHGVTLFMFMQSAFAALLNRFSGATDIVMGTPIAGRTHNDVDGLLGCFVNTLTLRSRFDDHPDFLQLLEANKQHVLAAFSHQHVPFEMLVEALGVERNLSYSPIFQIAFATEKDQQAGLTLPGLELAVIEQEHSILKFDLELVVVERDEQLVLKWDYNTDLFHAATIEQLAQSFVVLLNGILEQPRRAVAELPLLTEEQQRQLLHHCHRDAWLPPVQRHSANDDVVENSLGVDANPVVESRPVVDDSLVAGFLHQVTTNAGATAVAIAGQSLTYEALNQQANRLAHYLVQQGVVDETLVGIAVPAAPEMVVAQLAVLKAGGAYVPMADLSLTQQQAAVQRLELALVIGDDHLAGQLSTAVVALDHVEVAKRVSACPDHDHGLPAPSGYQLACVIDNAADPSAVAVEHQAITALLRHPAYPAAARGDRVVALGSDAHDSHSFLLWQALLNGACYQRYDNVAQLAATHKQDHDTHKSHAHPDHNVHTLLVGDQAVTQQPAAVVADLSQVLARIGHVVVGRDVDTGSLSAVVDAAPGEVLRVAGPDGEGGHSRWQRIQKINRRGIYPIVLSHKLAREVDYTALYVLDDHLQMLPPGAVGRVYEGGAHLSNTGDEALIDSPFKAGECLRQTGQWARWLVMDKGFQLHAVDRIEGALLIRGKPVSPAAVAQELLAEQAIADAWVGSQVDATGQRCLVAYVVLTTPEDATATLHALQHALKARLQAYELPAVYVPMANLPRDSHGEVDETQLAAVAEHGITVDTYVAPTNPREQQLCAIWQDLLGVQRIGIDDDFFLLGGHSLLATRLISRLRQELRVELPLRALFECSTVRTLAAVLAQQGDDRVLPPIQPVPRDQPLPVSYAQSRLWFIDRLEGGSSHYNMPFHFRLSGTLDEAALRQALQAMVQRHEVLRTRFVQLDQPAPGEQTTPGSQTTPEDQAAPEDQHRNTLADGADAETANEQVYQVVREAVDFQLAVHDLTALDAAAQEAEVHRLSQADAHHVFDLGHDVLLRAQLLRLGAEQHVLLLNLHHIAADGWSMDLFFHELNQLYAAYRTGSRAALPALTVHYADYAYWQREWLQGPVLQQQVDYWRQQLADSPPVHELPLDYPRPPRQTFTGETYRHAISTTLLADLKRLCQRYDVTLFMLLQTAFAVLLARFSQRRDVVVGTPIAGRTHGDSENMIGFFVNMLALRTRYGADADFAQVLADNKQTILDAFSHQHIPFEMLVEQLQPERNLQHSPIFQVLFALHQRGDREFALEGVQTQRIRPADQVAKFDLELFITEQDDDLLAAWNYNSDLFAAATIEQLAHSFQLLLTQLVARPSRSADQWPVDQLPLLDDAERQRLVQVHSRRDAWQAPAQRETVTTLPQRIADQAARTPQHSALNIAGETLTYAQLAQQARCLARALQAQGVGADSLVGIALAPSITAVVAQLATWLAGGAYVPLWGCTAAQQQAAQQQLNITTLLSDRAQVQAAMAAVDAVATERQAPAGDANGWHLACVLYRASDGNAIDIEHHRLVALMDELNNTIQPALAPGQVAAAVHGDGLDHHSFLLWQALCRGACYCVGEEWQTLAEATVAVVGPRALQQLADDEQTWHALKRDTDVSRSTLIVPADVAADALRGVLAAGVWAQVLALGNPHDTGGHSRWQRVARINRRGIYPIALSQPLMRSVDYTALYLLDDSLQPVPPGAVGRVYQGGARLHGPADVAAAATSEDNSEINNVIASPFHPAEQLRPTAQWARWVDVDGALQLQAVERLEGAVLIRGKHVSPAAVGDVLREQAALADAWVSVQVDAQSQNQLVAYVVLAATDAEEPAVNELAANGVSAQVETALRELQRDLQRQLGAYELPAVYVPVATLRRDENGTPDTTGLAEVATHGITIDTYVAPRTSREQQLCAIWQELLGVQRIGIEDDFFLLGGHSLLATRLISRIRHDLNVELPLRVLFENPTVRALATALAAHDDAVVLPPIQRVPRGGPLPVSFAQSRLWFIDQLEGGSSHYNMPFHFRLSGELNVQALQQAIQTIVERHEVLRTCYVQQGAEVYQVIRDDVRITIDEHDLSDRDAAAQAQEVQRRSAADAARLFNLSADVLLRVQVLHLAAAQQVVLLNMHHIASDGWSMEIFFRELGALYSAYCAGRELELPPLAVQYADYASWQRNWLQGDVLRQQLDFWQRQLAGSPPVHRFPLDYPRPRQQDFRGKTYGRTMDAELAAQIKTFCQAHNVTLFMFLQTAFAVLVSRYSGEHDVVMGTPMAGRLHHDVEPMIGFFINMLTLRNDLSGDPGFRELLTRNRGMILDAFAHQHIPFEMLVEELNPERHLSHSPLFQLAFAMPTHEQMKVALDGLEYQHLQLKQVPSKFDLSLSVIEDAQGLKVNWIYCGVLFERETIQRLCDNYLTLLQDLVSKPDQPISSVNLLAAAEQQQLLNTWQPPRTGGAAAGVDADTLYVSRWFEQQAARTPQRTALVVGDQQLTYQALNQRANRLAAWLIDHGVTPDTRVGLYTTPSLEMVVGILGILKAGGAYVPLDTAQPRQRLAYMLDDAAIQLVVSQCGVVDELPTGDWRTLCLDDAAIQQQLARYSDANPDLQTLGLTPQHLIYTIYTSGSTGQPKGVLVEHASVARFRAVFQQQLDDLGSAADGGWLWTASYAFDASVKSLLALTLGRRVVIATADQRTDAEQIAALLLRHRIDVFNGMPQLVAYVLEARARLLANVPAAPGLHLILSGDQVPPALWQQVADYCRDYGCNALNAYGPTELTINASYGMIHTATDTDSAPDSDSSIDPQPHIGRPVATTRAYVLDAQQRLLPIGASGELYVGGEALARGYLNQPQLDAAAFVTLRVAAGEAPQRLYRTGDRVRWRSDGQLEFLGRMDRQVKVHGFRMELGDIEAQILHQPQVRATHVLVRDSESGEKQLTAFVVLRDDAAADDALADDVLATVQAALREQLPEYMVPALWLRLDALPQLTTGKVDRDALLRRAAEHNQSAADSGPGNALEQRLCAIWQDTLQVDQVGLTDNFFALGGFSLLAIKLLNQIREELGAELDLQDLFEHPDVASLARLIQPDPVAAGDSGSDGDTEVGPDADGLTETAEVAPTARGNVMPPIQAADRSQPLPPSYAQQRLWFIHQLEGGSSQYNMPMAYRLDGEVDDTALHQALATIVERHEVLRTHFVEHAGQTVQVIAPHQDVPLRYHDFSTLPAAQRQQEVEALVQADTRGSFDLAAGPLLRAQLIKLAAHSHLLLINLHHIAADGWSMGVLFRELSALYNAYRQGRANPLPPLSVQYADYAQWQREWLQGEVLQHQVDYWREQLADAPALHSLPLDHPRPPAQSFNGRVHRQLLDAELSRELQDLCQRYDVTLFMLLQTAFALLVGRYSGERDVVIGTPVAGRSQAATEPLIGFFVNMLAVRTRFADSDDFAQLLARNKQTILQAFSHQHIPFEMLVEQLQPERSRQHTPIFQISFALYNNERGALALDGLEQTSLQSGQGIIKFDLELFAGHEGDALRLAWNYNTDLFAASTIESLAQGFDTLLRGLVAQPHSDVAQLPLLTAEQQRQLISECNSRTAWLAGDERTAVPAPDQHVARQIARQAAQRPADTALRIAGETLSYGQLNRHANRLAHRLQAQGVGAEDRVGIVLPPSVAAVVAQLAVLKAGAAYVPMAGFSAQQQQQAVAQLAVQRLIVDPATSADDMAASGFNVPVLPMPAVAAMEDGSGHGADDPQTRAPLASEPRLSPHSIQHLACVLYDAATGTGVEIEHQALLGLLNDDAYPQVAAGERVVVVSGDGHDHNSFLLWQALCRGACYQRSETRAALRGARVAVVDDATLCAIASAAEPQRDDDPAQCGDASHDPSHDQGQRQTHDLAATPCVIVPATFSDAALAQVLAAHAPDTVLAVSGPEGDGGHSRWQHIAAINRRGIYPITLSRPLARTADHTAVYLLDDHLQAVPVGAVGQVYQAGQRLRRAASDAPLLNSPFHGGEQLRASGDWARWVTDGERLRLQPVERLIGAVLIRGKRVSPAQVAASLRAQPAVADAWVSAQRVAAGTTEGVGDGQRQLVAYVQLRHQAEGRNEAGRDEQGRNAQLQALHHGLRDQLTAYQRPSVYVVVDHLPRTDDQRVDETRLPAAAEHGITLETYVAPDNPREAALCAMWQELLGVQRIGIDDDFFLLGGHSLLATRLISRIREELAVELPLRVLFERPTIRELAAVLDDQATAQVMPAIGKARAKTLDDESLEGEVF